MNRRHFSDTAFTVTSKTTERARALRRALTPAELKLWQRLKGGQTGVQFRRQHPIGPFIADFYCAEAKLAIEVDGRSHGAEGAEDADARRTAYFASKGVSVMRFGNDEVHDDADSVAGRIVEEVLNHRLRKNCDGDSLA